MLIEGQLYKRGYSMLYLCCLYEDKALYVLWEVHKGVCGNHTMERSFSHKIILQGYFCLNVKKDVMEFLKDVISIRDLPTYLGNLQKP